MYFVLSLIYALVEVEVYARPVVVVRTAFFDGHRLSAPLLFVSSQMGTRRISGTDQMGFSELIHGAFKASGFLADDRPHCTLLMFSTRHAVGQSLVNAADPMPQTAYLSFFFAAFPQIPNNGSDDFGI